MAEWRGRPPVPAWQVAGAAAPGELPPDAQEAIQAGPGEPSDRGAPLGSPDVLRAWRRPEPCGSWTSEVDQNLAYRIQNGYRLDDDSSVCVCVCVGRRNVKIRGPGSHRNSDDFPKNICDKRTKFEENFQNIYSSF